MLLKHQAMGSVAVAGIRFVRMVPVRFAGMMSVGLVMVWMIARKTVVAAKRMEGVKRAKACRP